MDRGQTRLAGPLRWVRRADLKSPQAPVVVGGRFPAVERFYATEPCGFAAYLPILETEIGGLAALLCGIAVSGGGETLAESTQAELFAVMRHTSEFLRPMVPGWRRPRAQSLEELDLPGVVDVGVTPVPPAG